MLLSTYSIKKYNLVKHTVVKCVRHFYSLNVSVTFILTFIVIVKYGLILVQIGYLLRPYQGALAFYTQKNVSDKLVSAPS